MLTNTTNNEEHKTSTLSTSPSLILHSRPFGSSSFTSNTIASSSLVATSWVMFPSLERHFMQNSTLHLMRTSSKSKVYFSSLGTMSSSNHSTSTKPSSGNDSVKDESNKTDITKQLSTKEKVKLLFKKYGFVFVGTYMSIYFATLLSIFGSLEMGLLDPDTLSQIFKVSKDLACETADVIGPTGTGASMNEAANAYAAEFKSDITDEKRSLVDIITGYLQTWEWTAKYAEKLEKNPHLANLAVAWFIVKFTEPVRLAAAIMVVPKVAKMVGKKVPDEGEVENKL